MDTVSGVGVLDKAMTVLRAVADQPQGLAGLQTATGLPRATAHRLASALEAHGVLRRDDEGRFELGLDLVVLGRQSQQRSPLVEPVRPIAAALRDSTGESVQLFIREGEHRRCVLSLESAHHLQWVVPEGILLPLAVGSSGRVLLGELGPAGWVESVGEREAGAASVSAPIRAADGTIIGALSVSGPVERLTREPGRRYGDAVVAAAASLRI